MAPQTEGCTSGQDCCGDESYHLQCNGAAGIPNRCCTTGYAYVRQPSDCCAPNAQVIDSRCDQALGDQCLFDTDCWDDHANEKCVNGICT